MTQVVAAIIQREGRILICRRRPDQSHPLKWEFPGGKVEDGESPAGALCRELQEELGIRDSTGSEIFRYEYAYPGKSPILLIFFSIEEFEGEPLNLIFHEIRWESPQNLTEFDFLDGDLDFIRTFRPLPPNPVRAALYTGRMTTIKMADPAQNEFLASLEAKSKRPSHFFRTMANRPEVLKNFVPLYGAILGPGSVERRTKELVYLTCAYANECAYCTAAHIASGKKAGITPEEMQAIQTEQDHGFSQPERAAIQYARELTRTADAADTRTALLEHFNDEQVVEITLVAAMANFTNRFNNGLGIKPEE
jgi:8-oxo-dGTP diphosphatase